MSKPLKPPFNRRAMALPTQTAVACAIVLLSSCAMRSDILPDRAQTSPPGGMREPSADVPTAAAEAASAAQAQPAGRFFRTPTPPARATTAAAVVPSSGGTPPPPDEILETAVSLQQLPLPVFIDTIFVTILKRNVSVDPSIAQRREIVSLRTGKAQTAQGLYDAARSVLRSYGIAVTEYSGLVRVTPATGPAAVVPEIRISRSLPDAPAAVRPVFQVVQLEAVSPANVIGWLRTLFGQRVTLQDDLNSQAVIISGQSDDVAAAVEAIRLVDQPSMRGRSSARITPLFWSADELARRLTEILQAQGYTVGTTPQAQAPIILLSVSALNSVIVFARSETILNYALRWAGELDQPTTGRGTAGYFTYAVRNLDAAELARTLQDVMNPAAGTGAAPNAAGGSVRSRVVVNAASNTLIIQGNPIEYQQWFGLLQELDRPPRSALVSVTIAEVRLTAGEQLGFEWLLNQFRVNGYDVNLSTLGAFGTAAIGGLAGTIVSSTGSAPRALFNALASTNRVRVLANPSVMARNGESASITVGAEVPVVTSQQTTGTTTGTPGGTLQNNLLQTIQYRPTGVILRVKPVIHSGGRIDLDIEQEVSSAATTRTGVSASPTITTRRINTKLSVADGATVLLGGLMQETDSKADTGVPGAKDVPLFGNLFKSRDDNRDRIELVILITPYVVSDEFEAAAMTDAFRRQFRWDATSPAQGLRPPRPASDSAAPSAGSADRTATPVPYIVPPVDETVPDAGDPARTPEGAAISLPPLRPDGPQRDAPPTNAPSSATPPRAPSSTPATKGQGTTPSGNPVSDPQILKDLQKALPRP